jgi:hypothetical protein
MEIAAYVCSHVFENSKPVLLVCRAGGDWQCLCGGEHSADEVPNVVGLNHLLDRDPSLRELEDLPLDWEAERKTAKHKWIRTPPKPDQ